MAPQLHDLSEHALLAVPAPDEAPAAARRRIGARYGVAPFPAAMRLHMHTGSAGRGGRGFERGSLREACNEKVLFLVYFRTVGPDPSDPTVSLRRECNQRYLDSVCTYCIRPDGVEEPGGMFGSGIGWAPTQKSRSSPVAL